MNLKEKDAFIKDRLHGLSEETLKFMVADLTDELETELKRREVYETSERFFRAELEKVKAERDEAEKKNKWLNSAIGENADSYEAAILAERQCCAEIAKNKQGTVSMFVTSRECEVYNRACQEIAAAIMEEPK